MFSDLVLNLAIVKESVLPDASHRMAAGSRVTNVDHWETVAPPRLSPVGRRYILLGLLDSRMNTDCTSTD